MFDEYTHPDDRSQRTAAVARAHDPDGDGRYSFEYRIVRTDGEARWVNTRSQTFFEGTGQARAAVRVIGAITDITEARAARELLQDREDRLRRAETLARMGHFTLDADGGGAISSDGNKVLFGFGPDSAPSFDDLFARVHPDDAPRLRAVFARAAETGAGFDIEFRVVRPDGVEATIRSLVECTRHPDTGRVRFFGTNLDMTAQKRAEAALHLNEERLGQAIHLGRLGIFDHDHLSGNVYWSPEQRAIWGLGPATTSRSTARSTTSTPKTAGGCTKRWHAPTIRPATAPSKSSTASSPTTARSAGFTPGRRPISRERARPAGRSAPSAPPPMSPSASRSRSICASRTMRSRPGSSACSSSASIDALPTPTPRGCACTASITTAR